MSDIPPIETARLWLIFLSCGLLQQMVDRRLEEVGRTAGFTIPDPCSMAGQAWLERRIRMIEEGSAQHPWLNRAVVRKEDNQMVGNISFHHKAPDPHLLG